MIFGWQITAALAAASMLVGAVGAYKITDWRNDAARLEMIEQHQQQVDALTERYRAKERQILKAAQTRKEAFDELAIDLSTHIADCRIDADGLQHIRSTVNAAFAGAK